MENTAIEWTTHTFNPWIGCTKVHAGCAKWGPHGTRSKTVEAYWKQPLKWNDAAKIVAETIQEGREMGLPDPDVIPERPRVFCASVADVFEEWDGPILNHRGEHLIRCPNCGIEPDYGNAGESGCENTPLTMDDLRRDLFALIDATPHLDWLLVTKRPENIRKMWPEREHMSRHKHRVYRGNVWLLTSVSGQESADKQIPELLKCRDLCPVLGLSAEPLLGPIDIRRWTELGLECSACSWIGAENQANRCDFDDEPDGWQCPVCGHPCGHRPIDEQGPDWVIVGGESGPGARPMHPDWARSIRDQCKVAGVAYFFKQWGEWLPVPLDEEHWPESDRRYTFAEDGTQLERVGKKAAGRELDGQTHSEFPAVAERAGL